MGSPESLESALILILHVRLRSIRGSKQQPLQPGPLPHLPACGQAQERRILLSQAMEAEAGAEAGGGARAGEGLSLWKCPRSQRQSRLKKT